MKLITGTQPTVEVKHTRIVLYSDQPDYSPVREDDAREHYGIPDDAEVEDEAYPTGYGAFLRTFTWYEVTV